MVKQEDGGDRPCVKTLAVGKRLMDLYPESTVVIKPFAVKGLTIDRTKVCQI